MAPALEPPSQTRRAELGLAACRFGLDWTRGLRARVDDGEVRAVLDLAAGAGLRMLDASSAYGEAEATLGATLPSPNPFRMALRAARGLRPDRLEPAVQASLGALWTPAADTLLVHASDLAGADGQALWAACRRLQEDGLVERVGFVAAAEDDVPALARRLRPEVAELPASLLDQRLLQHGVAAELAARNVRVHLRSVFLHGLLFVPLERLPGRLTGAAARLKRVRQMLAEAGVDPMAAALNFALGRPEAACVWVSAASAAELQALLAAAEADPPDLDWAAMALDDPAALDPRRWAA